MNRKAKARDFQVTFDKITSQIKSQKTSWKTKWTLNILNGLLDKNLDKDLFILESWICGEIIF